MPPVILVIIRGYSSEQTRQTQDHLFCTPQNNSGQLFAERCSDKKVFWESENYKMLPLESESGRERPKMVRSSSPDSDSVKLCSFSNNACFLSLILKVFWILQVRIFVFGSPSFLFQLCKTSHTHSERCQSLALGRNRPQCLIYQIWLHTCKNPVLRQVHLTSDSDTHSARGARNKSLVMDKSDLCHPVSLSRSGIQINFPWALKRFLSTVIPENLHNSKPRTILKVRI